MSQSFLSWLFGEWGCSNCNRMHRRAQKAESESAALRAQLTTRGLVIKGWWCMVGRCSQFNGEEHSPRAECRACGTPKPDMVR